MTTATTACFRVFVPCRVDDEAEAQEMAIAEFWRNVTTVGAAVITQPVARITTDEQFGPGVEVSADTIRR